MDFSEKTPFPKDPFSRARLMLKKWLSCWFREWLRKEAHRVLSITLHTVLGGALGLSPSLVTRPKYPPPYRETSVAIPLSHCVSCGIADYRSYTPTSFL